MDVSVRSEVDSTASVPRHENNLMLLATASGGFHSYLQLSKPIEERLRRIFANRNVVLETPLGAVDYA